MLAGIWALRLEQELTIRGSAFWAANLLTGIQSAARSTAGWGAAGILPVRNAACRQKFKEMIEKTAHFGYNKMTCKNGLFIGGLDV